MSFMKDSYTLSVQFRTLKTLSDGVWNGAMVTTNCQMLSNQQLSLYLIILPHRAHNCVMIYILGKADWAQSTHVTKGATISSQSYWLFLPFRQKRAFILFVPILSHFWCSVKTSVTFISNLSNFEKNPTKSKKNPKISENLKKSQKIQNVQQKKFKKKIHKIHKKSKNFKKCPKLKKMKKSILKKSES